ncbi:MAG: cupin domain-containing protein [Alphaproteobacteria bacterium]
MKKIDIDTAPERAGSRYPGGFHTTGMNKVRTLLADAAGLTQFGVHRLTLEPGAWSGQRHWHSAEDELIYVLGGEVTLITNAGPEILKAGDSAGFKAGEPDAHHFINHTDAPAVLLEIGTRNPEADTTTYPDIDLLMPAGRRGYLHKDGTPW